MDISWNSTKLVFIVLVIYFLKREFHLFNFFMMLLDKFGKCMKQTKLL